MRNSHYIPDIVIVFCCFLFAGCRHGLTQEELMQYILVSKHGLLKNAEINRLKITSFYKPQVLIAFQELKQSGDINNAAIKDSIVSHYMNYLYFIVSFSVENGEFLNTFRYNENLYEEAIEFLSFGIKEKTEIMLDDGKSLECLASFSQGYGNPGRNEVLFVFENKLQDCNYFYFTIHPNKFIKYSIKLEYNTKDIKKIPGLIL